MIGCTNWQRGSSDSYDKWEGPRQHNVHMCLCLILKRTKNSTAKCTGDEMGQR